MKIVYLQLRGADDQVQLDLSCRRQYFFKVLEFPERGRQSIDFRYSYYVTRTSAVHLQISDFVVPVGV